MKGRCVDAELFAREVGRLVRERRKDLGITQSMLAIMVGASRRYIVSLEMGETPGIRLDMLFRVLSALDMSMSVSIEEGEEGPDRLKEKRSALMERTGVADKKRGYASAFERAVEDLGRPIA